jgi:hypothetical protein
MSNTLNSSPYEVKQDPLQKRYIAASHSPSKAILDRKANMPLQATPRDDRGEKCNQSSGNDDHSHGLSN